MKLAGKTVIFGERLTNTQKNYLQQRVSALARHLHGLGYKVDMSVSAGTDSIYLEVNEKKISFRNHYGKGPYYTVQLSSFPNWKEAKNYVLSHLIPYVSPPKKLSHNFLTVSTNSNSSVKNNKVEQSEVGQPTKAPLEKEVLEYLNKIEQNMNFMKDSIQKFPENEETKGRIVHVKNLMKNTNRTLNKIKETVR